MPAWNLNNICTTALIRPFQKKSIVIANKLHASTRAASCSYCVIRARPHSTGASRAADLLIMFPDPQPNCLQLRHRFRALPKFGRRPSVFFPCDRGTGARLAGRCSSGARSARCSRRCRHCFFISDREASPWKMV